MSRCQGERKGQPAVVRFGRGGGFFFFFSGIGSDSPICAVVVLGDMLAWRSKHRFAHFWRDVMLIIGISWPDCVHAVLVWFCGFVIAGGKKKKNAASHWLAILCRHHIQDRERNIGHHRYRRDGLPFGHHSIFRRSRIENLAAHVGRAIPVIVRSASVVSGLDIFIFRGVGRGT